MSEEIMELVEALKKYADLEGSEIGEACSGLVHLLNYPDYMSEECYDAIIKEAETQLEVFKTQTKIIEEERVWTSKCLQWIS